jgi:hypothetical protein
MQEPLFDLLLNVLLQIGFFAIVAAVFSRLVAKARAKHQYCFYLAVLLFCLAVPVINTLWRTPSTVVAEKSRLQVPSEAGAANHLFWSWQGHSKQHRQFTIAPGVQSWIVGVGGCLFCFGWPASAELLIEFIGCGETHPYFLPPNLGWPARSSRPSIGLLSFNPQLSRIP